MQKFMRLALVALVAFVSFGIKQTQAEIIEYSFSISGGWADVGNPYGLPFSPNLVGSLSVDNTKSGFSALNQFSLATGSKTWTQLDSFSGAAAFFTFDGSGKLTDFVLGNFYDAPFAYLAIYFDSISGFGNSVGLSDGSNQNFCWNCVALGVGTPVVSIPEPAPYTMLIAGLGFLVLTSRRVKQHDAAA